MLNFAEITAALEATLKADPNLSAAGFIIKRGDVVNVDPDQCPWCGIYRTRQDYDPRALGQSNPGAWQGTLTVRLIVQATHMQPDACEDRLEGYLQDVLDAVWSDPTWTATVDMVTGIEVAYTYLETDSATIYYQAALVTITAEASTG